MCFFSKQDQTQWTQRLEHLRSLFQHNLAAEVVCELALPSTFINQAMEADVIYLDEDDNVTMEKLLGAYIDLASVYLAVRQ